MAKINDTLQLPKIVLHTGDTLTLQELALEIQKIIGSGSPLFVSKGDIIGGTGIDNLAARLAVGANGTFLKADSAQSLGLIWSVPGGSGDVVGPGVSVDGHVAVFDLTTGKVIKSAGMSLQQPTIDHVALADPHSQYALDTDLSGYQPIDALLTSLSLLNFVGNGNKIIRVNAGATDFEYLTLDKAAVGLSNVDNTSDVNKPVSTAQQTALDGKVDDAEISNMDNTADVNKSVANAVTWDGATKTVSTGTPSGGANGDLHFQYTA